MFVTSQRHRGKSAGDHLPTSRTQHVEVRVRRALLVDVVRDGVTAGGDQHLDDVAGASAGLEHVRDLRLSPEERQRHPRRRRVEVEAPARLRIVLEQGELPRAHIGSRSFGPLRRECGFDVSNLTV